MFTAIVFAIFYLVAGLTDISLFYNFSRWHFPGLLGGILAWLVSVVLGLVATTALQSITWFDRRLSKEPVNDPFGNQAPNLDLIAHSFWLALFLTSIVPMVAEVRKRRHLPVPVLPHWSGLLIFVAIGITVGLLAMIPRATPAQDATTEPDAPTDHG